MTDSSRSDRALVVLHMTTERVAAIPEGAEIVRYIQGEMKYFRERARPVIFVVPPDPKDPANGPDSAYILADLSPRTHETVLAASAPSAFFETSLDAFLRAEKITRVTLVGVDAATEVLLTAAGALARGYRVVVPEPCVASMTVEDRDAALHFINERWSQTPEENTHPAFSLAGFDVDSGSPP